MTENEKLERQIEQMEVQIADLQRENRYLRKRVDRDGKSGRILRRAHADALMLIHMYFSGLGISRDECKRSAEISVRRWYWARALLMAARVHNGYRITVDEATQAVEAVKRTVASLKHEGIERLAMRNPKYRQDSLYIRPGHCDVSSNEPGDELSDAFLVLGEASRDVNDQNVTIPEGANFVWASQDERGGTQ